MDSDDGAGPVRCARCRVLHRSGYRAQVGQFVSVSQETQMGEASFQQMKAEGKVSANPVYVNRVQGIGKRIAEAVGDDLPSAEWEFVVFESPDLNAFALPGGKVGVYTGMIQFAESDAELATVMGHEIAHVTPGMAPNACLRTSWWRPARLVWGWRPRTNPILNVRRLSPPMESEPPSALSCPIPARMSRKPTRSGCAMRRGRVTIRGQPSTSGSVWPRNSEGKNKPPEFLSTPPGGPDPDQETEGPDAGSPGDLPHEGGGGDTE
jgi:hypothetical protein